MNSGWAELEIDALAWERQSCTEGKTRREAMLQDAGGMFDRDCVVLLLCSDASAFAGIRSSLVA